MLTCKLLFFLISAVASISSYIVYSDPILNSPFRSIILILRYPNITLTNLAKFDFSRGSKLKFLNPENWLKLLIFHSSFKKDCLYLGHCISEEPSSIFFYHRMYEFSSKASSRGGPKCGLLSDPTRAVRHCLCGNISVSTWLLLQQDISLLHAPY